MSVQLYDEHMTTEERAPQTSKLDAWYVALLNEVQEQCWNEIIKILSTIKKKLGDCLKDDDQNIEAHLQRWRNYDYQVLISTDQYYEEIAELLVDIFNHVDALERKKDMLDQTFDQYVRLVENTFPYQPNIHQKLITPVRRLIISAGRRLHQVR